MENKDFGHQTNGHHSGVYKVKKGSYPSKQKRLGPIPLASFEDLPSDDQISSDDDDDRIMKSPDHIAIEYALNYDARQLLDKNLNASPSTTMSPPYLSQNKRGSETASQNTLKASDSLTPVATPEAEKSGSMINLKPSSDGTKKGSHSSLLVPRTDQSPSPETKRKGSWTDILFHSSKNRARSKSQSAVPTTRKPSTSPHEGRKKSIFKFLNFIRSKTPSKETVSSKESSQPPTHPNPEIEVTDTPRVSVTDTSENEPREELMLMSSPTRSEPKESEQDIIGIIEAAQSQMDRSPVDDFPYDDGNPNQFNPPPQMNLRKTLKRRESTIDDEVQSLPEILPSISRSRSKEIDLTIEKSPNQNITHATVHQVDETELKDDDLLSSGSELDSSKLLNRIKKIEPEDEVEKLNLLTQDSIDFDESTEFISNNEKLYNNEQVQHQIKSPTRRELTIIPIERPRSTTPINIVSLEAYINSTATNPSDRVNVKEKIKLSLPGIIQFRLKINYLFIHSLGDQFTAGSQRMKSPRKSNPSIWLDFCEKGLQSPRARRKSRANSYTYTTSDNNNINLLQKESQQQQVQDAFTPTHVQLTPCSPGNLTPVTPLDDLTSNFDDPNNKWPGFGDNFVDFNNLILTSSTQIEMNLNSDLMKCTCDCNLKDKPNGQEQHESQQVEQEVNEEVDRHEIVHQESVESDLEDQNQSKEHFSSQTQNNNNSCKCICHHQLSEFKDSDFVMSIWKNASFHKQESVSSDISSASSRLIGSSASHSSASKCSPNDETIEINS